MDFIAYFHCGWRKVRVILPNDIFHAWKVFGRMPGKPPPLFQGFHNILFFRLNTLIDKSHNVLKRVANGVEKSPGKFTQDSISKGTPAEESLVDLNRKVLVKKNSEIYFDKYAYF